MNIDIQALDKKMHLTVVVLSLVLHCCEAYTIAGCDNNNNIFLREDVGRPFTLVCYNIGQYDTVCWNTSSSFIGFCNNVHPCTVYTGHDVQLERPYYWTSKLTFTGNILEQENKPFSCYQWNVQYQPTETCYLRIIYPGIPDPRSCSVRANAATWTVNGYCRIPKIYLSTRAYSCTWYQSHNGRTTNDTLPMATTYFSDNSRHLYDRGACSFGKPLPTVEGSYVYSLRVSPGTQEHQVGNVEIARPGNPVATARWSGLPNTAELVVRNVRREDDESVYTYPGTPDQSSCSVRINATTWTVNGYCRIPKIYSSTGAYGCTWYQSHNGQNTQVLHNYQAAHITRLKEVTYDVHVSHLKQDLETLSQQLDPPNLPPVISGYTAVPEGADLRLTCTVTGGNPPVASVTFYCGDHADGTDTTEAPTVGQSSVTSVVNFDPFTAEDDGVTCVCTADWTPRPQSYTHRSEVTLTVLRAKSPTVTSLTLNGVLDELTVNESAPRLDDTVQGQGSQSNPLVISSQETVQISLVAFPSPSMQRVVFLGTDFPDVEVSKDTGELSTALQVDCQASEDKLYIFICTININDEDQAENGLYRMKLENSFGSVDVFIKLDGIVKGETSSQSHGISNTPNEEAETDFEEHINVIYGMDEASAANPHSVPSPRPVAVAWKVSSQNKTMEEHDDDGPSYQAISDTRREPPHCADADYTTVADNQGDANGPPDVYAVVDKTAKKNRPQTLAVSPSTSQHGDVYAQVNKGPKARHSATGSARQTQENRGPEHVNTDSRKAKPTVKPKRTSKRKSADADGGAKRSSARGVRYNYENVGAFSPEHPSSPIINEVDMTQTPAADDEYNTLMISGRQPSESDKGQNPEYSHIGDI
ncbi:hypothetical protein BaRGS_00011288 [Batillaria attramentaria]|uniref:Ig-like domain-containing protein n=1 Tax=Batillaria attramentaria TaxID=370345 RepID=A0ABD0LE61_9CAEN